jgi:predicted amidohydrolase YtcJ
MLKETGATVVLGTDWPAGGPFLNPMVGIWASMARPGETGTDVGLPPSSQAFSLGEALTAYTLLPARALGMGDVLGTLEEGKLADLVVLSNDIFSMPKARVLTDVQVDLTLMDGKIVFLREGRWPELGTSGF